MTHIKEPYGVDFVVENQPLSLEDRKIISDIISHYKTTGRIKKINTSKNEKAKNTRTNKTAKHTTV